MPGKLLKKPVFEYAQALQVLQLLLLVEELNPYTASLLAIIYKDTDYKGLLLQIKKWLYEYISPLLYTDPRNQPELQDKTLAISVYYFLENVDDSKYLLPSDSLINYLDYAMKEDWYDNSYLGLMLVRESQSLDLQEIYLSQ